MDAQLVASGPSELNLILDAIHDQQFERDKIDFDSNSNTLTIRFFRERLQDKKLHKRIAFVKQWIYPVVESLLRIRGTESYCMDDPAEVGLYEFNSIKYDEKAHQLVITAEPRFRVRLQVKGFRVEIADTGNILAQKKIYSF